MTLVFLAGIAVVDIIATDLPGVPSAGELIFTPKHIELHVGGHTCNVSSDLVQMGLKPSEITMVIPVGPEGDVFADFIVKELEKRGLKPYLQRTDKPTSKTMVIVVKGEDRRFINDPGANLAFDPDEVIKLFEEEGGVVFYVGATGILGRFDDKLPEVCKKAKKKGYITFVDPVTPYRKGWNHLISSMENIDVFHCNDMEAKQMTGMKDVKEAIRWMLNRGVKLAIVTMGEKGLLAGFKENTVFVPAFKVEVVDPTGAGDAFCAGVIHSLVTKPLLGRVKKGLEQLEVEDVVEILVKASAWGAACCMGVGTTSAVKPEVVSRVLSSEEAVKARVKLEKL